jgi:hypothetical protein
LLLAIQKITSSILIPFISIWACLSQLKVFLQFPIYFLIKEVLLTIDPGFDKVVERTRNWDEPCLYLEIKLGCRPQDIKTLFENIEYSLNNIA